MKKKLILALVAAIVSILAIFAISTSAINIDELCAAPSNVKIKAVATSSKITVTLTADDNGSEITSFFVALDDGEYVEVTAVDGIFKYTFTDLNKKTTYTITAVANNIGGMSDEATIDVTTKAPSSGGGSGSSVSVTKYEIEFNTNGGSTINTQIVERGGYVNEPVIPVKEGYVFGGWYIDDSFANVYNFNSTVVSSVTLYAKWTKAEEYIRYKIKGITIKDMSGGILNEIPTDNFLANVSVTNVSSDNDIVIILAKFTATGKCDGLIYVSTHNVPQGATFDFTVPVDNTKGEVDKLKAFCWSSLSSLTPVGNSASFPLE